MSPASITSAPFGRLPDGRAAQVFTLSNDRLRVRVTNYGARLVSIETPGRNGRMGHVLLGFDDVAAYNIAGGSFGALLGRYANRIGQGRFSLDGKTYQLATNENGSTLHGGQVGFARTFWDAEILGDRLALTHVSPDRDQGFPSRLTTRAEYRLLDDRLQIELQAITDRPTIVNLSSHPYFNLSGGAAHDILGHEMRVRASAFLPTDIRQIPTGEMADVTGTPFDFRVLRRFGEKIRDADPQLLIARGYDHCLVLDPGDGPAAFVREPASGRCLELFTNQPGLQIYSGNSLDGSIVGRGSLALRQSCGFALEAQNFPDAPNHPNFPTAILRPGEAYDHMIAYRFFTA